MNTNTTTETPWLLTVREVAQISRESEAGVTWAIREGKLEAKAGPNKRRYLITRQAVADWLGISLADVRSRCSSPAPGDLDDDSAA